MKIFPNSNFLQYSFGKFSTKRYIRYTIYRDTLYTVCVKSGSRQKNPKRDPFVTLKILHGTLYPVYVICGIDNIRFALKLVCVKPGCVIVEGDSLALFKALKNSLKRSKLIKSVTSLV